MSKGLQMEWKCQHLESSPPAGDLQPCSGLLSRPVGESPGKSVSRARQSRVGYVEVSQESFYGTQVVQVLVQRLVQTPIRAKEAGLYGIGGFKGGSWRWSHFSRPGKKAAQVQVQYNQRNSWLIGIAAWSNIGWEPLY